MAVPHNIRVSDRPDFITAKNSDFVKRKRSLTRQQIISVCAGLLAVVIGVSALVYNDALMGSGLCLAIGIVLWFLARHIERGEQKLQATQFLNAMFSSLLAAGYKFSMIVNNEGEIVYFDRAFQGMFPDMLSEKTRTLALLSERYRIAGGPYDQLVAAVAGGAAASVPVTMEGGDNRAQYMITISVDPVPRPSGFFLIRGK